MGFFRDNINSELLAVEDVDESIEKMAATLSRFEERGGSATLIVHLNDGMSYEINVGERTTENFLKVLITEYNDRLEAIRDKIDEYINGEMKII